jgi:hypothetical protein
MSNMNPISNSGKPSSWKLNLSGTNTAGANKSSADATDATSATTGSTDATSATTASTDATNTTTDSTDGKSLTQILQDSFNQSIDTLNGQMKDVLMFGILIVEVDNLQQDVVTALNQAISDAKAADPSGDGVNTMISRLGDLPITITVKGKSETLTTNQVINLSNMMLAVATTTYDKAGTEYPRMFSNTQGMPNYLPTFGNFNDDSGDTANYNPDGKNPNTEVPFSFNGKDYSYTTPKNDFPDAATVQDITSEIVPDFSDSIQSLQVISKNTSMCVSQMQRDLNNMYKSLSAEQKALISAAMQVLNNI